MSSDPIDFVQYSTIKVEQLEFAAKRMLEDYALNLGINVEAYRRAEVGAMVLEMRAKVTSAKAVEPEYEVENKITHWRQVPLRPVRDGSFLWLSTHTPKRLGRLRLWLRDRVQWERITQRQVTKMQQITYYGCPHINIPASHPGMATHIEWMGRSSNQIPKYIDPI